MKILVTGSSGFLGTALCKFLKQQNLDPVCLTSHNCDLRQQDSLSAFCFTRYTLIFHLAAWTQAGDFCLKHPGEQWIINQQINTHVLTWWAQQQPQAKLIIIGSSCSYAPNQNLIELNYMKEEPIDSLYTYAMTKRMLYQGARALHQQFGLRYLCAIPSTLYGAGYHTDERQLHFIFDLINKIIRGKEFGEPVILWGDGEQKRELVFIDDFVRILWHLTQHYTNELFNIGAGEEYCIRTFAELICELVDYPSNYIQYDTQRYVGTRSKCLNIGKIKTALGSDYTLTSLKDGLKKTIAWFYQTNAYRQLTDPESV